MPPKKSAKACSTDPNQPKSNGGRFSYEGLDRVMHEKARLGILASLAAHERGLLFNDLKQLCALTDGNLSRHLGVLSDAGLVEIWKGTAGRRPQTMYRLTCDGRLRFAEYISVLEKVVADAQAKIQADAAKAQGLSGGWSPA
jgi:DNA-binding MarR family transcriptional regulator